MINKSKPELVRKIHNLQKKIQEMEQENEKTSKYNLENDQLFNIEIPLCFVDKNKQIAKVNKLFCETFQVSEIEVSGQNCSEFWQIEDNGTDLSFMNLIDSDKNYAEHELTKILPDGSKKTFLVNANLYRDTKQDVIGIIVSFIDVTKFEAAQQKIITNQDLYRKLFETTGDGFWQIDANKQTISVNNSLCNMLGYSKEEFKNKSPLEFVDSENAKIMEYQISQVKSSQHRTYNISLTRKDGSQIPTIFNATSLLDVNGNPAGSFAFITDITEQKTSQKKLLESEGKFRNLAETSPAAIMIYQDNYWVYSNLMGCELSGYSLKELTKMKFWAFIHPDFQKYVIDKGKKRQTGVKTQVRYEFKIVTKSGEEKWVDLAGGSTIYNGKPAGIITVIDITARKNMEEELLENMDRFQFLSTAAYEGIILHKKGVVVDCNESFIRMSQYNRDEILGKNLLNYIPKAQDKVSIMSNMILKRATPYRITARRKDGVLFPVELEARDVKHNGQIIRIAAIRDITDRVQAEEKLNIRTEAIESAADGIAILEANGNYCYINKAHLQIYGYKKSSELVGKSWHNLYTADELERFEKEVMPEFLKTGNWRGKAVGKKKDGTFFDQEISLTALENKGMVCVVQDISKRIKAEKALAENEKLFRVLFENVPGGTIIIDEAYLIKDVNDVTCKLTGFTREELVGNYCDILCPKGSESKDCPIWEHGQNGFNGMDTTIKCKDGTKKPILKNSKKIRIKDKGYILEIFQDISQQKQIALALQQSEENFRQLAENIDQVFWLTDWKEKKLIYVSPAFEKVFELSLESAYKDRMNWSYLIHPDDIEKTTKSFDASNSVNKYMEATYRIVTKRGKEKWILDRSYPVFDENDDVDRYVSIAEDITKRKLSEDKVQNLLDEKEILLREVHHRIKNNMATICSLLRIHAERVDYPQIKSAFQDASSRINSMRILYDKLYRSDNFDAVAIKPYLTKLIDEIIEVFPQHESIEIQKEIEDFNIKAKITFTLGIIINEILTNSMKYAFVGKRNKVINVKAKLVDNSVEIIIQDNGVGVPGDVDITKAKSFGLQLIFMLTRQLNGSVQLINKNGAKYKIVFEL